MLCALSECLAIGRLEGSGVGAALGCWKGVERRSRACRRIRRFPFSRSIGKTPAVQEIASFLLFSSCLNVSKYCDRTGPQKIREV